MHNCNYNKTSLLVEMKRALWRIKQYKKDATKAKHPECKKLLGEIEKDFSKNAKKLEKAIVSLAKKGKYSFCEKC